MLLKDMLFAPSLSLGGDHTVGGYITAVLDAGINNAKKTATLSLGASAGAIPANGGGWGNLVSDLVMNATRKTVNLNQNGRVNSAWSIPNTPALAGLTLFAQAQVKVSNGPVPSKFSPVQILVIN